jgi:rhodanese-related sulfurtransferase
MNDSSSPIARRLPVLSWAAALLAAAMLPVNAVADAEEGESPASVPGTETVSTAEAYRLHQTGVTFVDVRNPRLYARRHIAGAHHLDLYTDFSKATLAAVVAPDQPVVLYCSGIKCGRSSTAAEFAVDWGYTAVKYFREGIVGWRDAGHPMVENSP